MSHKQRLSVADFDVVTKKYRATRADASKDHTYTHMNTHTHVSLVFSSEWVLSSPQKKTDLEYVECDSQVGFEVPNKVIKAAQHTAGSQHTPHHESRRNPHGKPSGSNATVEDQSQMIIHAALKEGQGTLDIQRRDQPRHTQYQANPKLRVLSARVRRDR